MASETDPTQKIVVHYSDGRTAWGFLSNPQGPAEVIGQSQSISLKGVQGETIEVQPSEIKAIFMVRTFEGNPNYIEFKSFADKPVGGGVWLSVHFQDGEVLEGVAPNSIEIFLLPMFYMTPPDPRSNNQAVVVSKSSLSQIRVLGLANS